MMREPCNELQQIQTTEIGELTVRHDIGDAKFIATEHVTTKAPKINGSSECTAKEKVSTEIKVVIHIPENITETIKQQKINKIYDILKPYSA